MKTIVLLIVATFFICSELFSQAYDRGISFTSSENVITGITVIDKDDNLIIGGSFEGQINVASSINNEMFLNSGDGINAFICKYNTSGELAWKIMLGNERDVKINGITTDIDGNIFVTGSFYDNVDFDPTRGTFILNADERDGFWAKYSYEGLLVEAHKFGESNYDTGLRIIAHKSEVLLSGYKLESTFSQRDVFVHKYSKSGDIAWTLNVPGLSMVDEIASIDIDVNGDFYISGSFSGTLTARVGGQSKSIYAESFDGFIIQVKNDGRLGWVKNIGGIGQDFIRDMLVRGNDIFLAFNFTENIEFEKESVTYQLSSKGMSDNLFLKYSTMGEFKDYFHFGSDTVDYISKVNFDESNNILLTGQIYKPFDVNPNGNPVKLQITSDFGGGYILCYNNDFELIWYNQYASESNYSYCKHINVNADNYVYVSGYSYGAIDVNPGDGAELIGGDGKKSYYVSCLRPYFTQTNILSINFSDAISVDIEENTHTVNVLMSLGTDVSNIETSVKLSEGATLNGEMPLDFTNLVDVEVIAEDGINSAIWTINVTTQDEQNALFDKSSEKHIRIYPNPGSGLVNIKMQNAQALNYALFSFSGSQLQKGRVTNSIVDLHTYPAGLYLLEIYNKEIRQTFKLYINENF